MRTRQITNFISVISLLFVFTINARGRDYVVFSEGYSDYTIIVSSNASESEKYAASELQSCFERIGGVTLPIIDCGKGRKGKRIIVGYNSDVKKLFVGEKERDSKDESFSYKSRKGDIIIVGGKERGTMYGVFSFLENELGCRWLAEDCTVLPPRKEYSFSRLNHSESPAFQRRSILYSGCDKTSFRAHNRLNEWIVTSPYKIPKQVGGQYGFLSPHTMVFLLPEEEFFSEHPEYFALIDGKRVKGNTQPCFSNPEVLSICVERLRKVMKEYPEISIYEVSSLDNNNRCQCIYCQEKANSLGSYTDLVMDFVNQVAQAIKDEFPEKKIEFLAYLNTRKPPVNVKPHENVVVRICNIEICHIHGFDKCTSENSKLFCQDLKKWLELSTNVYTWDYASNFSWYHIPYPNFYALRDNLCSYQSLGVKGVFVEGNHYASNSDFKALRIYILAKLLWNPQCDIETVIDDFMRGYYGSAAPYMRQYFDVIHSHIKENTHLRPFAKYSDSYYSEELIASASPIFKKAIECANDETILKRIEMEEFSLNFLKTIKTPRDSKRDGTYEKTQKVMEREIIRIGTKDSEEVYKKRVQPQSSESPSCQVIDAIQNFLWNFLTWLKDLV